MNVGRVRIELEFAIEDSEQLRQGAAEAEYSEQFVAARTGRVVEGNRTPEERLEQRMESDQQALASLVDSELLPWTKGLPGAWLMSSHVRVEPLDDGPAAVLRGKREEPAPRQD